MEKYKKAVVAGIGFVVTTLTVVLAQDADVIPDGWLWLVNAVLGVAGTYGVYAARNKPLHETSGNGATLRGGEDSTPGW